MTNDFGSELSPIERVRAVLAKMLSADGCAWHREQTHASLTRYLVEESAEVVDAFDRELPANQVAEELGDLLYQIVFHAGLAERDGEGYDFDTIAANLAQKLIDRHPHVFADRGYMSVEELNAEWENLKAEAAGKQPNTRGVFDGIPVTMPTLAKATKMISRIYKDDFATENACAEKEIGAELLCLVKKAHFSGIDADRALRLALIELESEHGAEEK